MKHEKHHETSLEMENKMRQFSKLIKIALGSALAILLANELGLLYGTAAGIISLLTIQDTKKETLSVSLNRMGAFVIATVIAIMIFTVFSFNPLSYGVFLLLFVGVCYKLKISDAIPINAVLATHYILEQNISFSLIINEALLLLIGAGIGTMLNLYIPNNRRQISREQKMIEEDLRELLSDMAKWLLMTDKSGYKKDCFSSIENHIAQGLSHAYTNMNNSFFQETEYYIRYIEMRKQQSEVLKEIKDKIMNLVFVPVQAYDVAAFIKKIVDTLAESNNAKELLAKEEELLLKLKQSPLPATREEFEDRAILYMVLKDFRIFLKMKETFADSLTEEQKNRYWTEDKE